MLMSIFDQENAIEMHVRAHRKEYERRGEKRGEKRGAMGMLVEACKDFGTDEADASRRLAQKFKLSPEEASRFVAEHWAR